MHTDWLKGLANFVLAPLTRLVGNLGHDLFLCGTVIKEVNSASNRLKRVHATVNAAKDQGQVVNEGRVPVWLEEAETLINMLEEIKLDSQVESDGNFFLKGCLCTRCFSCAEAQRRIDDANALMTEARTFNLNPRTSLMRSSSTPAILMISAPHSSATIADLLEMEENYKLN